MNSRPEIAIGHVRGDNEGERRSSREQKSQIQFGYLLKLTRTVRFKKESDLKEIMHFGKLAFEDCVINSDIIVSVIECNFFFNKLALLTKKRIQ